MEDIQKKIHPLVEAIIFKRVKMADPLYSSKLINSMGIIDLVVSIEDEFSIKINAKDIIEENFDTIERITAYVTKAIESKSTK